MLIIHIFTVSIFIVTLEYLFQCEIDMYKKYSQTNLILFIQENLAQKASVSKIKIIY